MKVFLLLSVLGIGSAGAQERPPFALPTADATIIYRTIRNDPELSPIYRFRSSPPASRSEFGPFIIVIRYDTGTAWMFNKTGSQQGMFKTDDLQTLIESAGPDVSDRTLTPATWTRVGIEQRAGIPCTKWSLDLSGSQRNLCISNQNLLLENVQVIDSKEYGYTATSVVFETPPDSAFIAPPDKPAP